MKIVEIQNGTKYIYVEQRKDAEMIKFTEREIEVLNFVCRGYNNQEIADNLYITHHTVKAHVSHILKKLDVENRTLAAFVAGQLHLVDIAWSGYKECKQCA